MANCIDYRGNKFVEMKFRERTVVEKVDNYIERVNKKCIEETDS